MAEIEKKVLTGQNNFRWRKNQPKWGNQRHKRHKTQYYVKINLKKEQTSG